MWDFKLLKLRNSFNFSYAINVLTALFRRYPPLSCSHDSMRALC
jgi:hypothetical protein